MSASDPLEPFAMAVAARVRALLADPPPELLDRIAERVVVRLGQKEEEKRGVGPEPLRAIIGGTAARCRAVEMRDAGLRRLAVVVGKRRAYHRAEVLAYLASKAKPTPLRIIKGKDK